MVANPIRLEPHPSYTRDNENRSPVPNPLTYNRRADESLRLRFIEEECPGPAG